MPNVAIRSLIHTGFFTASILENSTWTSTASHVNSSEAELWTRPFCTLVAGTDQPHRHECPPEQGWGILKMEGWVWEMFIEPVSTDSSQAQS